MSDDLLKMKHHKMLFELKFLYADLEYHQTIMNGATSSFQNEFLKRIEEIGVKETLFPAGTDIPDSKKEDIEEVNNEEIFQIDKAKISKESKELFRKIASLTHPDKVPKTASKQEREHKEAIFLRASRASEKDNLFALQQIAIDLGFEISSPTEEQMDIFVKEADGIKRKTKGMQATYAWSWNEATGERKDEIMKEYVSEMLNRVSPQENHQEEDS